MNCVHVTECLSVLRRYENIDPVILEIAADRGTRLHRAALGWVAGFTFPVSADIVYAYEQFKVWFEASVLEVYHRPELEIRNDDRALVGKVDLIVKLRHKPKVWSIIDLKNVAALDWIVGLQLAAYLWLARNRFPRSRFDDTRFAMWLPKDRPAQLVPYSDPQDEIAWWATYSIYNFSRRKAA